MNRQRRGTPTPMALTSCGVVAPAKPQLLRPVFALGQEWAYGPAVVATTAVTIALASVAAFRDPQSAVMSGAGAMAVLFGRGEPYVHRARVVIAAGLTIIAMSGVALMAAGSPWRLLFVLAVMAGLAGWTTETLKTPVPGPALLLVPPTIVAGIPVANQAGMLSPYQLGDRVGMVTLGAVIATVVTLAPWLILRHGPERRLVKLADRAVDRARVAVEGPQFDAARNAAWASISQARRALFLADRFPGRDPRLARSLRERADGAAEDLYRIELSRLRSVDAAGDSVPPGAPLQDQVSMNRDAAVFDFQARGHVAPRVVSSALSRMRGGQTSDPRVATVSRLCLLTVASGTAAILTGLDHWYWTPVCAVAVLWGSHTWRTWHRAVQRGGATVLGSLVGVALLHAPLSFPITLAVIAGLFLLAEMSFPRNYGLAIFLVTPMVLLEIHAASPAQFEGAQLALDRTVTTLLGCVFGVTGVLLLLPSAASRYLASRIAASLRLQGDLLAAIASGNLIAVDAARCVLHDDLVALDALAGDALGESRHRGEVLDQWGLANATLHLGHLLLTLSVLTRLRTATANQATAWQAWFELLAAAIESRSPVVQAGDFDDASPAVLVKAARALEHLVRCSHRREDRATAPPKRADVPASSSPLPARVRRIVHRVSAYPMFRGGSPIAKGGGGACGTPSPSAAAPPASGHPTCCTNQEDMAVQATPQTDLSADTAKGQTTDEGSFLPAFQGAAIQCAATGHRC